MTKNEALNIGFNCGVLSNSTQLTLGAIRRLRKNDKAIQPIRDEIIELRKIAEEKLTPKENEEVTDERKKEVEAEVQKEIADLLQEESNIEFTNVHTDFVDSLKFEVIELNGGEKRNVLAIADFLIEQGIIIEG